MRSPYLDPAVIACALSLRGDEIVLEHHGQRLGKAPLRRAFADVPRGYFRSASSIAWYAGFGRNASSNGRGCSHGFA